MKKRRPSRVKNLIGKKSGALTVVERAPDKKSWTMWKCICDCGNEHITYSTHLIRWNVTSCGCQSRKAGKDHASWTGFGEISGNKWNSIRRVTHKRKSRLKVSFDIDIEYAWKLFLDQNRKCALSGVDIYFAKTQNGDCTASLDRKDSKLGYTKENVQWVHKDVNRMKNIFEQQYFVSVCRKVAERNV